MDEKFLFRYWRYITYITVYRFVMKIRNKKPVSHQQEVKTI